LHRESPVFNCVYGIGIFLFAAKNFSMERG
jgi:hypothetical protein